MKSLDEFRVCDSMHESEYSHAFWCSFDMPTFQFISFHKIFHRLCITLLDVMEFYGIFDVFLLLKDRSSSSLLDLFSLDFDFQCQPSLSSLSESASVYFKWENWLRLSKHADTLRPLLPNLLNTPPFFFEFCLGDLDRSRLILENILRLGLGLRERLDRCPLSCFLVLIVLNSKYRDVPEHFLKLTIGSSFCRNIPVGLRRTWAHLGHVELALFLSQPYFARQT
ncbi:hypothetical protein Tco_1219957 [Tanacetum coccineum]